MNRKNSGSSSDYNVDKNIRPEQVRKAINDETADILGNFIDKKRKKVFNDTQKVSNDSQKSRGSARRRLRNAARAKAYNRNHVDVDNDVMSTDVMSNDVNSTDVTSTDVMSTDVDVDVGASTSNGQMHSLVQNCMKLNRYILYITNLNYNTTERSVEEHFGRVGLVKRVRFYKAKWRQGAASVQMNDEDGFREALQLHNSELDGRAIRVQLSEGGRCKSKEKKIELKLRNQELAALRNEHKTYKTSGISYGKFKWQRPDSKQRKPTG